MKKTGRITALVITLIIFVFMYICRIYVGNHYIKDLYLEEYNNISLKAIIILSILKGIILFSIGFMCDKTRFISYRDHLTNLYNRRFASQYLPRLLERLTRKNEKLSILVIDMDNFKEINDTYGHNIGDLVLERVADILQKGTRKSDVVVRWGGDEFLLAVPYADESAALAIIERIKKEINNFSNLIEIDISFSIGISTFPYDATSIEELIKKADEKMYMEKFKNKSNKLSQCCYELI